MDIVDPLFLTRGLLNHTAMRLEGPIFLHRPTYAPLGKRAQAPPTRR